MKIAKINGMWVLFDETKEPKDGELCVFFDKQTMQAMLSWYEKDKLKCYVYKPSKIVACENRRTGFPYLGLSTVREELEVNDKDEKQYTENDIRNALFTGQLFGQNPEKNPFGKTFDEFAANFIKYLNPNIFETDDIIEDGHVIKVTKIKKKF